MKSVFIITVTLALTQVYAYHDPDLNYHLSQVQNVKNCGESGYAYPTPAVQLAPVASAVVSQPIVSAPAGYSTGSAYQTVEPKITYAAQPATYQASVATNYITAPGYATKEAHGYATSAGLSASSSSGATGRTVTPLATYAQAPIIAKITAAPLIARFAIAPAKTTYSAQNFVSQQSSYSTGSLAKASLFSNKIQTGGPVVSQVFAAPSAGYATSPALRVQQAAQIGPASYSSGIQYSQGSQAVAPAVQVGPAVQYATTSISHAPIAPQYIAPVQHSSVTQYATPTVTQYTPASYTHAAPAVAQYSAPVVAQYSTGQAAAPAVTRFSTSAIAQYSGPAPSIYTAPAVTTYTGPAIAKYSAPSVATYSTPAITRYSTPVAALYSAPAYSAPGYGQYSAPRTIQYSAPGYPQYSAPRAIQHSAPAIASVTQYASPAVTHVSSPAVTSVVAPAHVSTTSLVTKNVHKEFLENYDAHPRYAFEYSVNDPHTGDIKQQKEERDGEVVKGQYSLVEPDGSVRTVNYVADWETGFHADVRNSKDNQH